MGYGFVEPLVLDCRSDACRRGGHGLVPQVGPRDGLQPLLGALCGPLAEAEEQASAPLCSDVDDPLVGPLCVVRVRVALERAHDVCDVDVLELDLVPSLVPDDDADDPTGLLLGLGFWGGLLLRLRGLTAGALFLGVGGVSVLSGRPVPASLPVWGGSGGRGHAPLLRRWARGLPHPAEHRDVLLVLVAYGLAEVAPHDSFVVVGRVLLKGVSFSVVIIN